MFTRLFVSLAAAAVVFNCSAGFAQVFSDQTASLANGLADQHVAWADYNDDGYPDFLAGDKLWTNNAGASFTSSGSYGSEGSNVWADYDNDGQIDFYHFANNLWRNQGSPIFAPGPSMPALPMGGASRASSWADHNNDGYVDLYVGGYEDCCLNPYLDAVVHNNGGTSFTHNPGVDQYNLQNARGVTSADFDRDGFQDVYVSNYRVQANVLMKNNGNGFFTDQAPL